MCLTSILFILALCSFNILSHALPLRPLASPKQPAVRRRVAYSVVAIDGGSAATISAAPATDILTLTRTPDSIKTVTVPASSAPPSIETVVVTDIVSELEPQNTMPMSLTQLPPKPTSRSTISSRIGIDTAETPSLAPTAPPTSQTSTSTSGGNYVVLSSIAKVITPSSYFATSIPIASVHLASSSRAPEAACSPKASNPKRKGSEVTTRISSSNPAPSPAITKTGTLPTSSVMTYDERWHTTDTGWNATTTTFSSASRTSNGTGRVQDFWRKG